MNNGNALHTFQLNDFEQEGIDMKTIEDFEHAIARQYRSLFLKEIELLSPTSQLQDTLKKHPQLLCILIHGGFYSPWAGALAFHHLFHKNGGKRRRPTGVAWRGFYRLPIYKQITQYLTQLSGPLDFDQCKSILLENTFDDMVILPEGTNCHYFNGKHLQPFISDRFIELSRTTNTPLLLFVHQGSEHWNVPISIPNILLPITRFLPRRFRLGIQKNKTINVPHMIRGRIPKLRVLCRVYEPQPDQYTIKEESKKIHSLMQTMYEELLKTETKNAESLTHP